MDNGHDRDVIDEKPNQPLDTSTPLPDTTNVVEEKQTLDTSAPTAVDTDPVAVAAQGDVSVKRSASLKSDAIGVGVGNKVDNVSHYITLYNEAINKIFKDYTIYTSYRNPKQFTSPKLSLNSDTDTCREQFLSFMHMNFSEFFNTTGSVDASTTFLTIVKKVKQFIDLMEVEMKGNQIVVTLHDIIDKLSSTSYESNHCKSEKLFMAILLAIQMLHCPSPSTEKEYTLKFKFAQSLLGPSRLQKTSKTCSGNKKISSSYDPSYDPVDENIFNLELRYLPKPPLELKAGGSKSRRRHRRHHKSKHARKTRRRRSRKFKLKTHRRRSARKNKKNIQEYL